MIEKIGLFPHGITLGPARLRPALIFKDQTETEILPVWLDPVDASLLLAGGEQVSTRATGAHQASLRIFGAFNIRLESVYFDEVRGSNQYATVTASQGRKVISTKVRAAELMSLAINARCAFYTNQNVIEKSRSLNLEWLLHTHAAEPSDNTLYEKTFEGIH